MMAMMITRKLASGYAATMNQWVRGVSIKEDHSVFEPIHPFVAMGFAKLR
jgi:hypothetical protein